MIQLLYPFRCGFTLLFFLFISPSIHAQTYEFFSAAEADIYYRVYGTGDPVIVLSGGPGISSDQIEGIAEKVGASHQAILLDQRGTGKSVLAEVTAENLNLDLMVEDLEALRKRLKIKKMSIIGHSWGAMYAMLYAKAYPKRIEKMVLISTGGVNMDFYDRYYQNVLANYSSKEFSRLKYLNQMYRAGRLNEKLDFEFRKLEYKARIHDQSKLDVYTQTLYQGKFSNEVLQLLLTEIRQKYDVKNSFEGFGQEVLIIHGKQSPIGEETALEVLANFPNARIKWIEDCGHFPWVEQPDVFYEALGEFLE